MSAKPPLAPSNVDVTLKFGEASVRLPFIDGMHAYGGEPLFCHAQSDGVTLSLLIDDVSGADVQSSKPHRPAADTVKVLFALDGKLIKAWDPIPFHYSGARALNFSATVSPTLGTLHLIVDDIPAPDRAGHTDGVVTFILVQQPDMDFQIVWIQQSSATIQDARKLENASIVWPPISDGSITGPMGFSVP